MVGEKKTTLDRSQHVPAKLSEKLTRRIQCTTEQDPEVWNATSIVSRWGNLRSRRHRLGEAASPWSAGPSALGTEPLGGPGTPRGVTKERAERAPDPREENIWTALTNSCSPEGLRAAHKLS